MNRISIRVKTSQQANSLFSGIEQLVAAFELPDTSFVLFEGIRESEISAFESTYDRFHFGKSLFKVEAGIIGFNG